MWQIPFEEYCFFIFQTVITALWSSLVFYPKLPLLGFLHRPGSISSSRLATLIPIVLFVGLGIFGWVRADPSTTTFYLGSILWWVSPVLSLQWFVAGRYILRMGALPVITAIMVPTLYLWLVDIVALNNGAWYIAKGTMIEELEFFTLPFEEATFFLTTNVMVVFGFLSWDRTLCVAENTSVAPRDFSKVSSPYILALFQSDDAISEKTVEDVSLSLRLITKGSKSFHLASTFFPPNIRQDIMQLYSWCRVCDDLVDDKLAQNNHALVRRFFDSFLDSVYGDENPSTMSSFATKPTSIEAFNPTSTMMVRPVSKVASFKAGDPELKEVGIAGESVMDMLLPFEKISSFRCIKRIAKRYHMKREELSELIEGFKLDMDMDQKQVKIANNDELIYYSCCVAASVGVMCCRIFGVPEQRTDIYERARDMGVALQLTNIARDIITDAKIGRVYIPMQWFEDEKERQELLDHPWKNPARLSQIAENLVGLAEPYYRRSEEGVAMLPHEVQKPVMLGLRFYKEIGQTILRSPVYPERAHVPLREKLKIAIQVYFAPTFTDLFLGFSYLMFMIYLLSW